MKKSYTKPTITTMDLDLQQLLQTQSLSVSSKTTSTQFSRDYAFDDWDEE